MSDNAYDLVGQIIKYETEPMSTREVLELYSHLIKSGQTWTLQGHYGRTATKLIDSGYINSDGTITEKANDLLMEP